LAESTPKFSISNILRTDRNLGRSPEAYGILLFNIFVLVMVLIFQADKYIVIAAYFLETLIIGIFNVIKMSIVALISPAARVAPEAMNCLTQGMQPYGRIFMQQFVVLLGGFVIIIFQNAVVFSVLLIIFKTFIDAWSQNKHNVKMLMKLAEKPVEDY
jgi:hypothetical protein